mmetsp:Transcript_94776/g.305969  ORF Transcript_94776/g.305969 Transcript_94776/m.305969 type:complete len:405 (+) Transcript_94776:544-1758(+)
MPLQGRGPVGERACCPRELRHLRCSPKWSQAAGARRAPRACGLLRGGSAGRLPWAPASLARLHADTGRCGRRPRGGDLGDPGLPGLIRPGDFDVQRAGLLLLGAACQGHCLRAAAPGHKDAGHGFDRAQHVPKWLSERDVCLGCHALAGPVDRRHLVADLASHEGAHRRALRDMCFAAGWRVGARSLSPHLHHGAPVTLFQRGCCTLHREFGNHFRLPEWHRLPAHDMVMRQAARVAPALPRAAGRRPKAEAHEDAPLGRRGAGLRAAAREPFRGCSHRLPGVASCHGQHLSGGVHRLRLAVLLHRNPECEPRRLLPCRGGLRRLGTARGRVPAGGLHALGRRRLHQSVYAGSGLGGGRVLRGGAVCAARAPALAGSLRQLRGARWPGGRPCQLQVPGRGKADH